MSHPKIGFIGFGEAAAGIAEGLAGEGVTDITAFDVRPRSGSEGVTMTAQSLMQLNVPNELRGRAMGSWVLAIGTAPVGHIQIGGLATLVGVASALIFNGVGLVALAATTAIFSARLRRL